MSKACSSEETIEAGRRFASELRKGDLVLLMGVLGAGKTTFVRGVASVLAPNAHVSSPSFTLMKIYRGTDLVLYHIDFYRLRSVQELWDIRIEEFLEDGVVLVEWPGRFPSLAKLPHWSVILRVSGDCRWIDIRRS